MAFYMVELYRADDAFPYHSFTLVASSDDEARSEARAHAPVGRHDLAHFVVKTIRGKASKVIYDSRKDAHAHRT